MPTDLTVLFTEKIFIEKKQRVGNRSHRLSVVGSSHLRPFQSQH